MTLVLLRRCATFTPAVNSHSHSLSRILAFSSRTSTFLSNVNESTESSSLNQKGVASGGGSNGLHLSPFFKPGRSHLEGCRIEVVDEEAWRVSSGLADAWRGMDKALERKGLVPEEVDEAGNDDPDFEDIEDMRIRGNLFYKLDRDSKEFEEYSFDFHRKNSLKKGSKKKKGSNDKLASGVGSSSKNKEEMKEMKKREKPSSNLALGGKGLPKTVKNEAHTYSNSEVDSLCIGKKVRVPTFNQLTAPYHEPFCLDIYVSKGSVRACIIHRATSKVVAVAHSISKDMKFDLASTKNATTCAAVGEVLAQRALADDIHNVVYTPRKGEKLAGKLQIVLQSVIDNGISVKVKIKQRKVKKAGLLVA